MASLAVLHLSFVLSLLKEKPDLPAADMGCAPGAVKPAGGALAPDMGYPFCTPKPGYGGGASYINTPSAATVVYTLKLRCHRVRTL